MSLILPPICACLQWWINYNVAANEHVQNSVVACLELPKTLLSVTKTEEDMFSCHSQETHIRRISRAHGKVGNKRSSVSSIKHQWRKQDGSGCPTPGETIWWCGAPPSVILSWWWCMAGIWKPSPSRIGQYHHAEEDCSEKKRGCDPWYRMTPLQKGSRGTKGECLILFNTTRSVFLLLKQQKSESFLGKKINRHFFWSREAASSGEMRPNEKSGEEKKNIFSQDPWADKNHHLSLALRFSKD